MKTCGIQIGLTRKVKMRTQPQDIIKQLQADNSRLAKEAVLEAAMTEGLDEFFEGLKNSLPKIHRV